MPWCLLVILWLHEHLSSERVCVCRDLQLNQSSQLYITMAALLRLFEFTADFLLYSIALSSCTAHRAMQPTVTLSMQGSGPNICIKTKGASAAVTLQNYLRTIKQTCVWPTWSGVYVFDKASECAALLLTAEITSPADQRAVLHHGGSWNSDVTFEPQPVPDQTVGLNDEIFINVLWRNEAYIKTDLKTNFFFFLPQISTSHREIRITHLLYPLKRLSKWWWRQRQGHNIRTFCLHKSSLIYASFVEISAEDWKSACFGTHMQIMNVQIMFIKHVYCLTVLLISYNELIWAWF